MHFGWLYAKNGGFMISFGKWNFKHLSPRKLLITGVIAILMVAVTVFTLVAASEWEVTVNDNGNIFTFKTAKTTVGEAVSEAGITLDIADIISPAPSTPISEATQILIRRAFDIQVEDMNGVVARRTAHATVGPALEDAGIFVDADDEVIPPVDSELTAGTTIKVTYVDIEEVTEQEDVGYEIIEKTTDEYGRGTKKTIKEGENGLANVTYRIISKNGVETAKEEVSREVLREPVAKVVAVGTKAIPSPSAQLASRSGSAPLTTSKVIICRATAYDGSYETLGYYNPKTCLGRTPTVGTVAVDPRVIPLGTRMYIETVDGSYVYGECFAGDTGGSIKGNRVDLFMASRAQALAFGSRQVKVYILD